MIKLRLSFLLMITTCCSVCIHATAQNTGLRDSVVIEKSIVQKIEERLSSEKFLLDKSFLLPLDFVLTRLITDSLYTDPNVSSVCSLLDSIKVFVFRLEGFSHDNDAQYFAYGIDEYLTDVDITIWYFKDSTEASTCFNATRESFDSPTRFPISAGYQEDNVIMMVEAGNQQATELWVTFNAILRELFNQ